ncbi:MAG: hypothetical protein NWE89_05180 [Candidatus Bathyarchaeota archaeon]|nr:hypothetical protein [Candidatus Bathyarchaeota archaeon]
MKMRKNFRKQVKTAPKTVMIMLFIIGCSYLMSIPSALSEEGAGIRIYGHIIDEYDNKLEDVLIKIRNLETDEIADKTHSSEKGYFTLSVPTPSVNYDIYFIKDGYVEVTLPIDIIPYRNLNIGEITLIQSLKIESSSSTRVTNPGKEIMIPVTIGYFDNKNNESIKFQIKSPEEWKSTILNSNYEEIEQLRLFEGDTLLIYLKTSVPIEANGYYDLSLKAIGEETNSTLGFVLNVVPWSDSILSCTYPSKLCKPGDTVKFIITLSNPIDDDLFYQLSLESIQSRGVFSIKNEVGETISAIKIGKGRQERVIIEVSPPPDAKDNEYQLTFIADSLIKSETVPLTVTLSKDVSTEGVIKIQNIFVAPPKTYPGDNKINLKAWIINTGSVTLEDVEVQIDLESPFKQSWSGSNQLNIGNLYPNQPRETSFYFDLNDNGESGEHLLTLDIVTSTHLQSLIVPVLISEKAKLEIMSITPSQIQPGKSNVDIKVVFANVGDTYAEDVRIELLGGNLVTGTTGDYLGFLDVGESREVTFTVNFDSLISVGDLRLNFDTIWTQNGRRFTQDAVIDVSVLEPEGNNNLIFIGIIGVVALGGLFIYSRKRTSQS